MKTERIIILTTGLAFLAALACLWRSMPPAKARIGEPRVVTSSTGKKISIRRSDDEGSNKDDRSFRESDGDEFTGVVRRDAKTSIVDAPIESFDSVRELLMSLEPDEVIRSNPLISRASDNPRLSEEKRNVRVRAFLFAAKKSDDNDYHVMIADNDEQPTPDMTMTVEVSGLPEGGPDRDRLVAARDSFESYMNSLDSYEVSGTSYDFYSSIPVWVEGSLFFDVQHSSGDVGPIGYRSATVWEIHPVTSIEFIDP